MAVRESEPDALFKNAWQKSICRVRRSGNPYPTTEHSFQGPWCKLSLEKSYKNSVSGHDFGTEAAV